MILSWFEHRPRKEIPPQWMWHLPHEINAWFEQLDNERAGTDSSGDEVAPMMQNALTKNLRG